MTFPPARYDSKELRKTLGRPTLNWDSAVRMGMGTILVAIAIRMFVGAFILRWRSTWKGGVPMSGVSHVLMGLIFGVGGIGIALQIGRNSLLMVGAIAALLGALVISRISER